MNFGRGGRLFGRGSSNRRAKELSDAGIPLGAKLGLRNLAQKPSNQLGLEGSGTRALGFSRSAEKVPEIALELLKNKAQSEHAPDRLVGQVLCDPGPSDAVDSRLIGRNGLGHRIQGWR
jgi:hypothetical protein